MKIWKKLSLIVGLVLIVGIITACSNSKTKTTSSTTNSSRTEKMSKSNNKTLILYFSLTGTTKEAAQYIKKETGADMLRLEPEKPYGDYDSAARRGDRERRNNIHPALKTNIPNLNKYQTILIGYPTWWQRPPMLIETLFDKYDFKGKTVIPFTTSISTPIGPSEKYIRRMVQSDGASFKNGTRYDNNKSEVRSWLNNLGLLK